MLCCLGIALVAAPTALADTAEACKSLLVVEKSSRLTHASQWDEFKSVVRKANFGTKQEAVASSLGIGAIMAQIVGVELNYKNADRNWAEWREEFYRSDYSKFSRVLKQEISTEHLSGASAKLAETCLNVPGPQGRIQIGASIDTVVVGLKYIPYVAEQASFLNVQVSPNSDLSRACAKTLQKNLSGTIGAKWQEVQCQWDPEVGIDVTLAVKIGAGKAMVTGRISSQRLPCADYAKRQNTITQAKVACNDVVERGYFWEIGDKRVESYRQFSFLNTGLQPACGSTSEGKTGLTYIYWPQMKTHGPAAAIAQVFQGYCHQPGVNATTCATPEEIKSIPMVGGIESGTFSAVCKRQGKK